MTTTFAPKDPAEQIFYGISFAALLGAGETISSATASMRALVQQDTGAAAMLIGAPVIEGSTVKHLVGGGIAGNRYRLGFTVVTSAGQTFIEGADLAIAERD